MVPLGFPNSLGVPQVIKIGDDFSTPPLGDLVFWWEKPGKSGCPVWCEFFYGATCHFLANGGGFQACSGHGKTTRNLWKWGRMTKGDVHWCSPANLQLIQQAEWDITNNKFDFLPVKLGVQQRSHPNGPGAATGLNQMDGDIFIIFIVTNSQELLDHGCCRPVGQFAKSSFHRFHWLTTSRRFDAWPCRNGFQATASCLMSLPPASHWRKFQPTCSWSSSALCRCRQSKWPCCNSSTSSQNFGLRLVNTLKKLFPRYFVM